MLRTLLSRRTVVSLCRQTIQFNRRQDRIKRFLPQALQQKCTFAPARFLSTAQTSDTDDFKDEKDEADLQRPVPSTSLNLPADNKQLLLEIIDKLTEAGTNFIIPKNGEVIDAVCENMEELFQKNVNREFFYEQCLAKPNLIRYLVTNGEEVAKSISHLSEFDLHPEETILLLSEFGDEMLDMGAEQMANRVNAMIVSGLNVENKKIAKAIKRCPAVLWARNPDEMVETASMLRNFFTKKQISYMIYTAPEILLMNFEELEEKYEYIFMHMNIENEEMSKSKMWVKRPLEEIMERHQFLVKCGRYRTPDEKRPQIKRENPFLYKILDRDDEKFSAKIAGVTLEEWMAFRSYFPKWLEIESGERDAPYEKFIASKRKRFERKQKSRKELMEKQNVDPLYVLEEKRSVDG